MKKSGKSKKSKADVKLLTLKDLKRLKGGSGMLNSGSNLNAFSIPKWNEAASSYQF
jgi:hypothetical protein